MLVPLATMAAEVQVPFDTRGKILVVDARLADRIGLFTTDHPGFSEARLFQLADSTFILEITRRVGGAQARERLPLDAAGADSVRALVSSRIAERAPSARYDQEARPLLMAMSAGMGFGFYGWAVPYLLDMSGEGAFATYMLTTAGAILVPAMMTQRQNVTYPQATLGFYGATRGIVHGLLIAEAMNGEDDSQEESNIAIALATSVGEALVGFSWGSSFTPGRAAALNLGGDLGLTYGFGIAELSGRDQVPDRDLTVLGVTAAGLAGGYALGRWRDYSYGDVGIMRMGGIVGAFTGLAASASDDADDNTVIASSMAGAALGLVVGDAIVKGAGYSFGQSVNVGFVTVAGGLIGLSVGTLIEADEGDNSERVVLMSTALGAMGGYAGGVAAQSRGGRPAKASSLRFGVEPRWVSNGERAEIVPHLVARLALSSE